MMYKRRDTAIAELIANCWDAGANRVEVILPDEADYDRETGVITITDDGSGMNQSEIQHQYLVVGRNRRQEEKTISKTLEDWGVKDIGDEDERLRYDFLALTDERRLVIIEIKRSGHAVTLDDLQRLEKYKDRLSKAHDKELYMVMLCSGSLDVSEDVRLNWKTRRDGSIRLWSGFFLKHELTMSTTEPF